MALVSPHDREAGGAYNALRSGMAAVLTGELSFEELVAEWGIEPDEATCVWCLPLRPGDRVTDESHGMCERHKRALLAEKEAAGDSPRGVTETNTKEINDGTHQA